LDHQIILAGKQDVTTNSTSSTEPSLSTTFNKSISSSIINNNKNIEDRDHFHYAASYGVISKNTNGELKYNLTKSGPAIVSGELLFQNILVCIVFRVLYF
jgi:hypothetical protein